MQKAVPAIPAEASAVLSIARELFAGHLLAAYLHGSAVNGGLRPQSDVDLLVVIDRPMTDVMRKSLLSSLLRASGRHPARLDGPRCIELMVFLEADLSAPAFPARSAFVYGEWLREDFEAGAIPDALSDPEITLVLAQAPQEAQPLFGPTLNSILPEIPDDDIRRAMREGLPALLANLRGDERNVLLTLARMWRTAATGEFVTKDVAVDRAMLRLPEQLAQTLAYGRDAYLGKMRDDWTIRQEEAHQAAAYLHQQIMALLQPTASRSPPG